MKHCKTALKTALVVLLCLELVIAVPLYAANYNERGRSRTPHRFWNSNDPDPVVMIIDGILVRPVSFVATILGGVFYVVTLPFSVTGGNAGQAWDQMVKTPARATFDRPLGIFYVDFDKEKNEGNMERMPAGSSVNGDVSMLHQHEISEDNITLEGQIDQNEKQHEGQ